MTDTDRLLRWYAIAGPEHLEAGLRWYPEAESLATRIVYATGGKVTQLQACGVIAALSPRCSWPDNKIAALATIVAWHHGRPPETIRAPGTFGPNVVKAYRILDLPDFGVDGRGVCDGTRVGRHGRRVVCKPSTSGCTCPLHGPKVSAFYSAIAGTADDGCMDVWATRAARVDWEQVIDLPADDLRRHPELSVSDHRQLRAAYRSAAGIVGVAPREFQAVVWLVIRDSWTKSNGGRFGARREVDLPF